MASAARPRPDATKVRDQSSSADGSDPEYYFSVAIKDDVALGAPWLGTACDEPSVREYGRGHFLSREFLEYIREVAYPNPKCDWKVRASHESSIIMKTGGPPGRAARACFGGATSTEKVPGRVPIRCW